jgi:two-component sensor histidine kinase
MGLIGRMHRQLHDPSGAQLGLAEFLRQISADLIDAGGKPGIVCTVEADESVTLAPDAAVPVALIIAEAIANALEHGFADRETGTIAIHVREDRDTIDLTVVDDGRGLPDGFDLEQSPSLGLRLARMLSRQLGASFTLSNETGAAARLRLPRTPA